MAGLERIELPPSVSKTEMISISPKPATNKYLVSQHLSSRNQNYATHFRFAFGAGIVLLLAGMASIIHAIVPDILVGYSERKVMAVARLARMRYAIQNKK